MVEAAAPFLDGVMRMAIRAEEVEATEHIEYVMNLAKRAKDKANMDVYRALLNAAVHHGYCATEMGHMADKVQKADDILLQARLEVRRLEAENLELKQKIQHAEQNF